MTRLILASASPRRAELLTALGLTFEVGAANVDETIGAAEPADDAVVRLAFAKADALAGSGAVVLAADTVVVIDDHVLGKPRDPDDARAMLRLMSARTHLVHTGVAVVASTGRDSRLVTSEVDFGPISAAAIEQYLGTGEPFDKAGSYGIQGPGAQFVCGLRGSLTNVRGLPVEVLADLLRPFGIELP